MDTAAYSPVSKLFSLLSGSPTLAALFLGVFLTPIVVTCLAYRFRPGTTLYKASLASTAVVIMASLVILLRLGPPAGLDPVGIALLLFLLYYIPIWLGLMLVFWGLWVVLLKR